ncbi:hypothetical protein CGI03_22745 [Vibrio parahaemolyticus]|nr:hypothetical protein CGI03_22745 [Vibrio parahaemolyticus]TOL54751.1 hypothetical protein CGH95_22975 [Vibrio parahaemolyticus]TOL84679.1 hypothetical protein CGH89_22160 [Vibrio parahaemolyticus]
MATNAALRGEQRYTTQLKPLCHIHKSQTLNQNCQALRIPLERFVMFVITTSPALLLCHIHHGVLNCACTPLWY